MGNMANAAPLRFHSQVLENPGPPLLRMALETHILIKLIPFPQTGPRPGAVRCMTVCAFHRPLQNPMVVGKVELTSHFLMA
jgi:hypothetical protein